MLFFSFFLALLANLQKKNEGRDSSSLENFWQQQPLHAMSATLQFSKFCYLLLRWEKMYKGNLLLVFFLLPLSLFSKAYHLPPLERPHSWRKFLQQKKNVEGWRGKLKKKYILLYALVRIMKIDENDFVPFVFFFLFSSKKIIFAHFLNGMVK